MKRPGAWSRAARRACQGVFLALFFATLFLMTEEGVRRLPLKWLFQLDPLAALGTLLSSWVIPVGLLWALATVALTVLLGRVFCGWACPFGTLHQLAGWATRRLRRGPAAQANRWRPHYSLKYALLAAVIAAALAGTLLAGLLDPISLAARSFGSGLFAAADWVQGGGGFRPRIFIGAWLTGGIFLALFAANRWIVRWWCRALCPLGALLGWISRTSLFRVQVDAARCTHCNLCAAECQGADEPFGRHRASECHVCLNCVGACPERAIRFRPLVPDAAPAGGIDLARRTLVGSAAVGVLALPLLRASAGSASAPGSEAIRPPGARDEREFLARCVRCGACVNACPTSGLQPSLLEAGLEGLWTPVLVARRGWCEPSCTLCGQVCPTGAIAALTAESKGWAPPSEHPVRIGTAFYDFGRCLPLALDVPCIVCQEVCPTSPKAIWLEDVTVTARDGRALRLQRPHLDPALCVGCGLCEAKCPVNDLAGIRVSRIGESRSRGSAFTLAGGVRS